VFIGHYALAFAARRSLPSVSLGTLFIAVQLADLVWPVLVIAGIERFEIRPGITAFTPLDFSHYPWSHSLAAMTAWGVAFAAVHALARRGGARVAALLVALVVSHWVLDYVSHRPDMPLAPGAATRFGLGLWNSIPATLGVEGAMFIAGVWLYTSVTRARDRIGSIALWALVGVLAVMQVGAIFGPPPPSNSALLVVALAAYSLLAVAWWIDRHRETLGDA